MKFLNESLEESCAEILREIPEKIPAGIWKERILDEFLKGVPI